MTKSEIKKLQKIEAELWNDLRSAEHTAELLGENEYDNKLCKNMRAKWCAVHRVLKALNIKPNYSLCE